jgi:hypothetical protein
MCMKLPNPGQVGDPAHRRDEREQRVAVERPQVGNVQLAQLSNGESTNARRHPPDA